MSGLLSVVRHGLSALLALALVLGPHGLVGAIHSAHHMPAPVESHDHDAAAYGDQDEHGGAPGEALDETCPVAAAALHHAATATEAPPAQDPPSAPRELVALGGQEAPRAAWREPARGRAPPLSRSLSS